jgi:AmmeMemoRadiSam system protein A
MGCPEIEDRFINKQERASPNIAGAQGEKLLRFARSAIELYLRCGEILDYKKNEPSIPQGTGIFVTLWGKDTTQASKPLSENSSLRGCIGHLQSNLPLIDLVQEVAIGAATRDPRFPPLTLAELDTIRIEIAILSPLRMINDLQQINIGQDGLMLEGLGKRGLLLPKVAVRMGWDRELFLEGVCIKAGLPLDCWPGTCNLYGFTTVVFDEAEMDLQRD